MIFRCSPLTVTSTWPPSTLRTELRCSRRSGDWQYVDLNLTALAPRQVYLLFLSSFMIAQALYSPDPCFDSLNIVIVIVIVIVIFNLHNPSFREQICSNFIEKSGYQVQWAIQTLIQRHPKTALCWIQSYLYASVSNTDPLRIAQYTTLCTFLRKNWNLEFEIHGNWFFSFFLRVVSLEKKCLFPKYFCGFFKISPGANNPEEFLFNKQHIVHWSPLYQAVDSSAMLKPTISTLSLSTSSSLAS